MTTTPNNLVGRTIKSVRMQTPEEMEALDWYTPAVILELDDGTQLFPSKDYEGNNGGALFGKGTDGSDFTIA